MLDNPAAVVPIPDRMAPAGEIVAAASYPGMRAFGGKMALEVHLPGRMLASPVVLPVEPAAASLG